MEKTNLIASFAMNDNIMGSCFWPSVIFGFFGDDEDMSYLIAFYGLKNNWGKKVCDLIATLCKLGIWAQMITHEMKVTLSCGCLPFYLYVVLALIHHNHIITFSGDWINLGLEGNWSGSRFGSILPINSAGCFEGNLTVRIAKSSLVFLRLIASGFKEKYSKIYIEN